MKKTLNIIGILLISVCLTACNQSSSSLNNELKDESCNNLDTYVDDCEQTNTFDETNPLDFNKLKIEDYQYSDEFTLGDNLSGAICELVAAYDNFDSSKNIFDNDYEQFFISKICQNSRYCPQYIETIADDNDGILSLEQIEYVQYSLTNHFIDMSNCISDKGIDVYDTSSGLSSFVIDSYEAEQFENTIKLVAKAHKFQDEGESLKQVEIKATLIKNPRSCFDGYSLLNVSSVEDLKQEGQISHKNESELAQSFFATSIGIYDDIENDEHSIEIYIDGDDYAITGMGFYPIYASQCTDVEQSGDKTAYYFEKVPDSMYMITVENSLVTIYYGVSIESIDNICGKFDLNSLH